MKIKVGDKVYSSKDQPVMVILAEHDKYNITHMAPDDTKYAEFPGDLAWTEEEMLAWMTNGDQPHP